MSDHEQPTTPPDAPATDAADGLPLEIDITQQPPEPALTAPDDAEAPEFRGTRSDPWFGFVLALALSIGLTPAIGDNADLRYTLAWGALAGVGVIAWLLGSATRIGQEDPANVGWGIGFGIIVGTPFVLFFSDVFGGAMRALFPGMGIGSILAYLVFVMPLAETLFFRSLLQTQLSFWMVGLLGGIWAIVLFFPVMWTDLLAAPAVAAFFVVALMTTNLIYAYVRDRNGLAAAWICQIVANIIMLFLPLLG